LPPIGRHTSNLGTGGTAGCRPRRECGWAYDIQGMRTTCDGRQTLWASGCRPRRSLAGLSPAGMAASLAASTLATKRTLPYLGRTFTGWISPALRLAHLFDHLVGASAQRGWYCKAKRLRNRKVDHQLVLRRRLDRKVGGLLALEDAVPRGARQDAAAGL